MASLYTVLGVAETADREAIVRAYRTIAKEYHPDVSDEPHARETFKWATRAKQVLTDAEARDRYDRLGHAAFCDRRGWDPEIPSLPHTRTDDGPEGRSTTVADPPPGHGVSGGEPSSNRTGESPGNGEGIGRGWTDERSTGGTSDGTGARVDPSANASWGPYVRNRTSGHRVDDRSLASDPQLKGVILVLSFVTVLLLSILVLGPIIGTLAGLVTAFGVSLFVLILMAIVLQFW